jgi:GNAT superfamily N-acetyltransferase
MLEDGYTDVPPGKIAAVVTYLELREPPAGETRPLPAGFSLERLTAPDLAAYRALFRAVGEPWLWFSRLSMTDAQLSAVLDDPLNEVYVLQTGGDAKGLLELDRRTPPDVEIGFLGVTPDLVGAGTGAAMMGFALERARVLAAPRVVLHTCSLDHPRALSFYLRLGFRPYKRAIEVADDPRLAGLLPLTAAPHVPVIYGERLTANG